MSQYQIADLEQLTGIKAHTIRIWEKRYKLIEPYRTPTNIRYYNDAQAKKLLNVATLLAQGIKISRIAELQEEEIAHLIISGKDDLDNDAVCQTFINDMVASMLVFDEMAFEKAFSASVNRLGMYNAMLKVVYPFLNKTGILWSINEAMPVQEHFASCVIRRKLMAAIDGLPYPTRKKMKFVLFLPPEEWHEIGLLFSDYIIRSQGYPTVYLGANVPLEDLQGTINAVKPTHLLTFFITGTPDDHIEKTLKIVAGKNKGMELWVGGSSNLLENKRMPEKAHYISNPAELMERTE